MSEGANNRAIAAFPDRSAFGPVGITSGARKFLELEDRVFTGRRLLIYGCTLIAWALVVGWFLSYGWIPGKDGDFWWMWLSGRFAVSDPARIFDYSAFSLAEVTRLVGAPKSYVPVHDFAYPPTLLFFLYPLGFMPYSMAFAVWMVATLLLYLAAIYTIIPRPAALIATLASAAVGANVLIGHNGFLTAGLIGLSLVYLKRRPWLSGIFLGLLTYKPQFGVLFPLALLASRNWRALGSATVTTLVLAATATIVFGHQGWQTFIACLFHYNSGLSATGVPLRQQSLYGLLHWEGVNPWISWTVHLTVAAVVAATICAVWAKPIPHALKAAVLCIGSVTVTPYVLPYDLCVLSVGVAFLVSDGLSRGFLPGERTVMLICWAGTFSMLIPIAPISPVINIIFLCLAARRIVAYRKGPLTARRDAPLGCTASNGGS